MVVLWLCRAASWAVFTVWSCTPLTTQLHKTTVNHSQRYQCRISYAVVHGLILLMMGIMMPETCWDRSLIINIELVAFCWFSLFTLSPDCILLFEDSLTNLFGWYCVTNWRGFGRKCSGHIQKHGPGFCLEVRGENTDISTGQLLHWLWFKFGPAELRWSDGAWNKSLAFMGAFAKKRLLASCLSVRPHGTIPLLLDGFNES